MSCSLCRLPFIPEPNFSQPRGQACKVLTDKQLHDMKYAVGMGQYVLGLVADMVYLGGNSFIVNNVPFLANIAWEAEHRTFVALHSYCAHILRYNLNILGNSTEDVLELGLIEHIVGPTMEGRMAGRFKQIDYESIHGDNGETVDIESLWSEGSSLGESNFDWLEWKRCGLDWTAVRSDVFPRFRPQVQPARLLSLGPLPESTEDIITTQPLDILHILLPYLPNKSFINLLSTCRTFRHHALTTFQPHARTRVLELAWAVPTTQEYTSFLARKFPDPKNTSRPAQTGAKVPTPNDLAQLEMASAEHSPHYADWNLYLSHVHRSTSMCARRWVWALAVEVARVWREKRAAGLYAEVVGPDGKEMKSPAWRVFEQKVAQSLQMNREILAKSTAAGGRDDGKPFRW